MTPVILGILGTAVGVLTLTVLVLVFYLSKLAGAIIALSRRIHLLEQAALQRAAKPDPVRDARFL